MPPKHPAIPGATTHAANTCGTPPHAQLTLSMPTDAVAAPTKPPTTECVVETGMPYLVAKVKKTEDAMMAHMRLRSSTCGWPSYRSGLTMPLRTVSATRSPTDTLPASSQTEAIIMACLRVSDLEDTEVAKELATSLAPTRRCQRGSMAESGANRSVPMFHASRAAKMAVMARM